jgi:nicotinate-nucleotide--dimethylbenzimidazole phosphoribosyltransferase
VIALTERDLRDAIAAVHPLDAGLLQKAQERLDSLTKPPGSLGRLEEIARRLSAIQGKLKPSIGKKRVYTLAGDHGVTEEGVSAFPKEVTPQMVLNFLHGGAAINVLTRHVGAEIVVVDMGVAYDFGGVQGLLDRKIGPGTRNFTKGPAMTREEMLAALGAGLELAADAARDGVTLLGVGEMGIGNTTPAAAILSIFSGLAPEDAIGRGTGVDDAGLARKADAIRRGIAANAPDANDPLDVLQKMGGYEIAGMAGIFLGAAVRGLPVLADGFISSSAALVAVWLCPDAGQYIFLSHLSQEKGHKRMVEVLGERPLLDLEMRLGEGTGAALAMQIVEASAKILSEMATFAEAGVSGKED